VKITDMIETGAGHFAFGNRVMNDHNAKTGGCGRISLAEAIHISSNIGISRAIVNAYGQDPAAFVNKLYEMKLNEPLKLEIPGTAAPKIKHPSDKSKNGWSPTTLPWLSIGYETQIPPIYTLSYYNAIANNGKFIKPIFVKSISKNGQIVKSFETEVIKEAICKPSTLKDIKEVLLGVLEGEKGTAKNVRSKFFRIAGKTGTAQISKGKEGYKAGGTLHQVSFCGYFPSENPQYTMIVVIREPHKGYPSGGKMAGSVFKSIAEQVMGLKSTLKPYNLLNDSTYTEPTEPYLKVGYYKSLSTVMTELNLPLAQNSSDWVKSKTEENKVKIESMRVPGNVIPDVQGMGAKDAVFLAERLGLRVQLFGRGKVISQSLKAGSKVVKGNVFKLNLE
jgi:cell division protein FtsI (penicillin-binding protein 3)